MKKSIDVLKVDHLLCVQIEDLSGEKKVKVDKFHLPHRIKSKLLKRRKPKVSFGDETGLFISISSDNCVKLHLQTRLELFKTDPIVVGSKLPTKRLFIE